jgi:hypothetical protein
MPKRGELNVTQLSEDSRIAPARFQQFVEKLKEMTKEQDVERLLFMAADMRVFIEEWKLEQQTVLHDETRRLVRAEMVN